MLHQSRAGSLDVHAVPHRGAVPASAAAPDHGTFEKHGLLRAMKTQLGSLRQYLLGPTVVGVIAGLLSLKGSAWALAAIGVAAALTLALLVRETRIDPAVISSGEPVTGRS